MILFKQPFLKNPLSVWATFVSKFINMNFHKLSNLVTLLTIQGSNLGGCQCDQVARLFYQHLATYNTESCLPNGIQYSKVGSKFYQMIKALKNCQRLLAKRVTLVAKLDLRCGLLTACLQSDLMVNRTNVLLITTPRT